MLTGRKKWAQQQNQESKIHQFLVAKRSQSPRSLAPLKKIPNLPQQEWAAWRGLHQHAIKTPVKTPQNPKLLRIPKILHQHQMRARGKPNPTLHQPSSPKQGDYWILPDNVIRWCHNTTRCQHIINTSSTRRIMIAVKTVGSPLLCQARAKVSCAVSPAPSCLHQSLITMRLVYILKPNTNLRPDHLYKWPDNT